MTHRQLHFGPTVAPAPRSLTLWCVLGACAVAMVSCRAWGQTTQGDVTTFPLPPWAVAVCGFLFALGAVGTAVGVFYWKFSGPAWAIIDDFRKHLAAVETKADDAGKQAVAADTKATEAQAGVVRNVDRIRSVETTAARAEGVAQSATGTADKASSDLTKLAAKLPSTDIDDKPKIQT